MRFLLKHSFLLLLLLKGWIERFSLPADSGHLQNKTTLPEERSEKFRPSLPFAPVFASSTVVRTSIDQSATKLG